MEQFTAIEFHQTRDFGRKMNATFEFIKQNFKPLTKSILFIAGPPILVASLMMGSFLGDMLSSMMSLSTGGDPERITQMFLTVNFWLQLAVMLVFYIVSIVTTTATINNYIILYGEKKTNNIETSEVWQRVRDTFGMYLGTTILVTLLVVAVYIVGAIPMFLLAAVSPFLIFFGMIFFMIAILYVMVTLSLVFIIRGYEHAGFVESIQRSFHLIKGKWWSTFGLIIILSIIVSSVSSIFFIPWYIMFLMQVMHSVENPGAYEPDTAMQIIMAIFLCLYYLCQMILHALPNVGIAFQYFNLVEMKEARGLMNQINDLGQSPPENSSSNETY
jgi:hypothetical protein